MGYLKSCKIGSAVVESQRREKRHSSSSTPSTSASASAPTLASTSTSTSASSSLQIFHFNDLEVATDGFSVETLLGKGSHGCVYKAILKNGREVAVKRASYGRRLLQDEACFENEIRVLSSLNNPHFVKLLGICEDSDKEKLLVVELMQNGTLFDLLHQNQEAIPWSKRFHIALQTARAVQDIHSINPPLIHRDIKSSNIFIDKNWNAKLGDFGLALYNCSDSISTTPPAGTLGYLDPEYTTPDMLSTKNDVFSFGILLLEIVSGRNAIDVNHNPPSIVDWAIPLIKNGDFLQLCDPRLTPPKNLLFVKKITILAAKCVRERSTKRPDMVDVVRLLEEVSSRIGFSMFNGIADKMRRRKDIPSEGHDSDNDNTQNDNGDAIDNHNDNENGRCSHSSLGSHKKVVQRNLRVYDESRGLFQLRGNKPRTGLNLQNRHRKDTITIKNAEMNSSPLDSLAHGKAMISHFFRGSHNE